MGSVRKRTEIDKKYVGNSVNFSPLRYVYGTVKTRITKGVE
jgi:hypothetical protein